MALIGLAGASIALAGQQLHLVDSIQTRHIAMAILLRLGLAATRFVFTALFESVGGPWQAVAGWMGLALCVLALYAALAFELDDVFHRAILPTLRPREGARAGRFRRARVR